MSADYFVSSLPPLAFDAPAPLTLAQFDARCREALGDDPFSGHADAWRDLDAQMRNAAAEERARLQGADAQKWCRPAAGVSLFWQNRIRAAFQQRDPGARERLLDKVRWDAAGEMTPPTAPLSRGAALTYRIRLEIVLKRQALSREAGDAVFDRLTAASKPEL
jgi:hypothetical protein